jgi:hypothetical protein
MPCFEDFLDERSRHFTLHTLHTAKRVHPKPERERRKKRTLTKIKEDRYFSLAKHGAWKGI